MPEVKYFNTRALSNTELYTLKWHRWEARTNLRYLCNNVLGYKDVGEVHMPLINHLQKFQKPDKKQFLLNDDLSTGFIKYKPIISLDDFVKQEQIKRRLILDFRGSLKTTINAMAHTIQWLLNYPNIGCLIIQSSIEKAEEILAGIKTHFQYNQIFRELFPEHVPQKKVNDWCTKGAMTTEALNVNNLELGMPHKEGSIITGGIDKGMSGKHMDFLKFSDIVDPTNTKSSNSCQEIIKQYYLCENLLTSPIYWIDIEGTRYAFADLYGKIIKDEAKMDPELRIWSIYSRGCYKKKTLDGLPEKFTPEELFLDDLVEEKDITKKNPLGKVSWWPEKYPVDYLEHKRNVSGYEFATQMYNNPQSAEENMIPFPIKNIVWITRPNFETKYPIAYYEISIDTAETNNQKSNYSAIVVGAFTGAGNCIVADIIHGKFLPDALIDEIYKAYIRYNPIKIKIEETSFSRGLMAGIRKEGEKLGIYLPIDLIKRDNQTAKQERIINTLQPYFFNGQLRFLDDLKAKDQLIEELNEFPTGTNDDILDAISDLFQNKTYFGKEFVQEDYRKMSSEKIQAVLDEKIRASRAKGERLQAEYRNALPIMMAQWAGLSDSDSINPYNTTDSYNRTGGL